MDNPKAMQNMRIGVVVSIVPVGVKWSTLARWPRWKIQTMAPNVALRLSRLSTIALAGTTTLPVIKNSTVKVTRAITPAATGTLAAMAALESTNWADWPPTRVENGAGRWRIVFTSVSPLDD